MSETGKQIADLLINKGRSGAEMTHALKILGDGSMEHGFSKIGKYFVDETRKASLKGTIFGGALGVGLTLGIVGINKKNEDHEVEGQLILKALKKQTPIIQENVETQQETIEGKKVD